MASAQKHARLDNPEDDGPVANRTRSQIRKPNPMPENWFCDIPGNVISQILKFLEKPTRNLLLGIKGMRAVVLAEPAFWREVSVKFEKELFHKGTMQEKGVEMEALGRIAGFVQKVQVCFQLNDMDWISSVIPHLPQFPQVTEVLVCRSMYGPEPEPEKFASSIISLAGHFERVTALKVSSFFISQSKSLFETLIQKWDSLLEVEVGLDDGEYLGESGQEFATGPFGFAQAVAESGKLVSLKCDSSESESSNVYEAIRDTLLALESRGHECLKTLHVIVPDAEACVALFPFFVLNSLTTLQIGTYDNRIGKEAFSKKFLSTLENMCNLKALSIDFGIETAEADMIKFLGRAQFNLQSLSIDFSHLNPFTDAVLRSIAATQKGLEKLRIEYQCSNERNGPTSAGASAVERLPEMVRCIIWCKDCDDRYMHDEPIDSDDWSADEDHYYDSDDWLQDSDDSDEWRWI